MGSLTQGHPFSCTDEAGDAPRSLWKVAMPGLGEAEAGLQRWGPISGLD